MRSFEQLIVTRVRESLVVTFKSTFIIDDTVLDLIKQDLMQVVELAANDGMSIVFSFRGVEAISSALVGKLALFSVKAKGAGVRWSMCEMSPPVAEVFHPFRRGDGGAGVFAKLETPPQSGEGRALPPVDERVRRDVP